MYNCNVVDLTTISISYCIESNYKQVAGQYIAENDFEYGYIVH